MNYELVYDFTQDGLSAGNLTIMILLVISLISGTVFYFLFRKRVNQQRKWLTGLVAFALVCSYVIVICIYYVFWSQYLYADRAIEHGKTTIVEGVVSHFEQVGINPPTDYFCVKEACFRYTDKLFSVGFNKTASEGGPIQIGLPVKITYITNEETDDKTILRLEVAEQP